MSFFSPTCRCVGFFYDWTSRRHSCRSCSQARCRSMRVIRSPRRRAARTSSWHLASGLTRCQTLLRRSCVARTCHSDPAAVLRRLAFACLNSMIGIPSGINHSKSALGALPLVINPLINPQSTDGALWAAPNPQDPLQALPRKGSGCESPLKYLNPWPSLCLEGGLSLSSLVVRFQIAQAVPVQVLGYGSGRH